MPIYWLLFFIGLLCFSLGFLCPGRNTYNGVLISRAESVMVGLLFIIVGIITAFRDAVLDTWMYVSIFRSVPTDWDSLVYMSENTHTERLFILAQGVWKMVVSDSHYSWFALCAAISLIPLYRTLKRYSPEIGFTAFLFIAGTSFTWLINGMRQYIVVCILFSFTFLLLRGKRFAYIVVICLLSLIHKSVLIILPVMLIMSVRKIYGKGMILIAGLTVAGIILFEDFVGVAMDILQMEYQVDHILESSSAGFMRLAVVSIPTILALCNFDKVKHSASPFMALALNMSFVGVCFMLAAAFTSGILVGRIPAYFTVYNLCLLPWLIDVCFTRWRPVVTVICVGCYSYYFYYQMCVAWDGLPYVSYALGMSYL